jgi:hypothetical protein
VPKLKTERRRGTSHKKSAKPHAPAPSKAASGKGTTGKAAKHGTKQKDVELVSADEEAAFTEALIQSGEAACLDSEGKLPAGATHKIVEDEAGRTKVVRRRFSMT